MRWTSLCAIGLLALSARGAGAQDLSALRPGTEVRISSATVSGRYTVVKIDSASLMLRGPRDTTVISVLVSDVARLSARRQRTAGAGALRAGLIGLGAGAVAGAVIGLASGDDECTGEFCILDMTAGQKAVAGGVVLGLAGFLVGGVIGLAHPGSTWEPVVLRSRVSVVPLREGRMGIAISRGF